MPCGWEGNRRSGVALVMPHRLRWLICLRAHCLRTGDEHPAYAPYGVWRSFTFLHFIANVPKFEHLTLREVLHNPSKFRKTRASTASLRGVCIPKFGIKLGKICSFYRRGPELSMGPFSMTRSNPTH